MNESTVFYIDWITKFYDGFGMIFTNQPDPISMAIRWALAQMHCVEPIICKMVMSL